MKKLVLNIFALGIFATSFTACEDAQYDVIDNMIYISEAASASAGEIILGKTGEVATGVVTVKSGRVAESDIKVQIGLDNAALASYNNRNDVEFAVIPAEYISLPSEVVIPAGASQVEVPFSVTSFDGEKGVEYAAPIKVISATDTPISTGSSAYIITFGKPLVQKAPGFVYNNKMNMVWPKQVDLANFTLEWWVRCTNTSGTGGFSINNQAMFSFSANKELYIRFGDIVYTDAVQTWKNLYNFLQIKTMGIDANYDSGDPNKNPLKWGEWIHFAHTYDAATGAWKVYVDGVQTHDGVHEFGDPAGPFGDLDLTSPTMNALYIGGWAAIIDGVNNQDWMTYFNGSIDEVRMYNRALTDTEIGQLWQQEKLINLE